MPISKPFQDTVRELRNLLLQAPSIDVGEWQSMRGDPVRARTLEVEDVSFAMDIPKSLETLQENVRPSLPWAEDHFLERVSGIPHNPPPSAAWWPYRERNHEKHVDHLGRFSHTYPERLWPMMPGYASLTDVVELLKDRLQTRQAFIPIWYPVDGRLALDGKRVPCTIGYHVLVRNYRLKIVYYIRSCDFLRHFRDDVYMAGRLAQWLCEQIGISSLRPGRLVMHISSLHTFEADRLGLEYQKRLAERDAE